mgnify:CR=1 FL=1
MHGSRENFEGYAGAHETEERSYNLFAVLKRCCGIRTELSAMR